ncbi:MAG: sensor histidine kinase [Bdellovibrionota bacterium]
MMEKVENTTDRIAKIVQGLRSFSRDGSKDPYQAVNLQQMIDETLSFCRERFQASGTKLLIEGEQGKLSFEGRSTEVSQVLLNLLNNANDAIADRQEKWIKVSTYEQPDWVELRVTDCGNGIPLEVQKKIFQPFFTTKAIGKGTGMGLSISIGIIKGHFGELKIDNQCPNTCFVIRLPKKRGAAALPAAA